MGGKKKEVVKEGAWVGEGESVVVGEGRREKPTPKRAEERGAALHRLPIGGGTFRVLSHPF